MSQYFTGMLELRFIHIPKIGTVKQRWEDLDGQSRLTNQCLPPLERMVAKFGFSDSMREVVRTKEQFT